VKVDVVALVLHVDQAPEELVAPEFLALHQLDEKTVVALGRADAVDAADRGDDDDVAPRQEGLGGGVAHAIDLVVDDRVLVDEGVGRRNVGFGLVVVVVADEVLDGVVRKEVLHLAVELGGQGLVRSQDERRLLRVLDDVGDAERLARARDAEQDLVALAPVEPSAHVLDGSRLIATRYEVRNNPKRPRHRTSLIHHTAASRKPRRRPRSDESRGPRGQ
jgi:hypothetical protein